MKICEYGCGREGKFYFKTPGKWCCSKNHKQCPVKRKETSIQIKKEWGDPNGVFNSDLFREKQNKVLREARKVPNSMSNSVSYNHVKEKINDIGYELISSEYNGYYDKLKIICSEGHEYETSWNVIRAGSRCPICYRKNQSKSMTKDFSEIESFFSKKGFKLLSKKSDYKNQYSKLETICPGGHEIIVYWAEFRRQKNGCPVCSGYKKKTLKEIKNYCDNFGYKCLSKKYINGESKLKFKCPEGHMYETTWCIFQQGSRCPKCNNIERSINYSGPNCHFWKGGISCEPYCEQWLDKEYKESIKERDGNKCLNPECNKTTINELCLHHINYNKKDCGPKNLITVCKSCNSKANADREWHKFWYQAILYRRYNYKYED